MPKIWLEECMGAWFIWI